MLLFIFIIFYSNSLTNCIFIHIHHIIFFNVFRWLEMHYNIYKKDNLLFLQNSSKHFLHSQTSYFIMRDQLIFMSYTHLHYSINSLLEKRLSESL